MSLFGSLMLLTIVAATQQASFCQTWGPSMQLTEPQNMPPSPGLKGSTLRQVFRTTSGGRAFKLHLSNLFGREALKVSKMSLAPYLGESRIDIGSTVSVKFQTASGEDAKTVIVPPGKEAESNPIKYPLKPLTEYAITMYVDSVGEEVTGHPGSRQTSYLAVGDRVAQQVLEGATQVDHWYLVSGVDVVQTSAPLTLACLGDSLTDGRGSLTNGNTRWTDLLASDNPGACVINAGLGGNCVVAGGLGPTALSRFRRDTIDRPGVTAVLIFEGINDLGAHPDDPKAADKLIAAYQEMIELARRPAPTFGRTTAVYGATLTPCGRSFYDKGFVRANVERVNNWIRSSHAFDQVFDFYAATEDPVQQGCLLSKYDSGDHLHLNTEGYRVLAGRVKLKLPHE